MSRPSGSLPLDPIEAQVQQELLAAFRVQLGKDSGLILLGHLVLVALVMTAFRDNGPGRQVVWWLVIVGLAAAASAAWQRVTGHFTSVEPRVMHGTRALILLVALAWGVGAAVLLPTMSPEELSIVQMAFAGIVGGALSALAADRASMHMVVTGIYGPVLLRLATTRGDRYHLLTAVLVAVFAGMALVLHRRTNHALIENLRTRNLLVLSHKETARESAYLSSMLRSVPTAVAVLDGARRVRMVNTQFETLFGYSADEFMGRALDDVLVPMDGKAYSLVLQERVAQGEVITEEVARRAKDGRNIMVRLSAAAVPDPTSPGMVVLYEDITQQQQAQEALRASEARFRGVVEKNLAGFCFWERTGRLLEANDELLRIIGYTREDLTKGEASWRTLIPPDQLPGFERVLHLLAAGGTVTPWETEVFRKDRSRVPIMIGVAALAEGGAHGAAFVLDISDRKRAEHQLGYKSAMLEAQVNTSIDGILIVDAAGKTVLTNKRMAEVWGIPDDIAEDFDDRKRLQFVVQQTKKPDEFVARVEYLYAHPTETSRDEVELLKGTTLDRYSAPVIGHDGQYYGRIWAFRDVTDSKRAERAMRDARDLAERAAESRSMFLANMSHEIRTPMNAVLGMIEIVLDSDLTTEQRHALGLASSSAESLLGVLNDVLDFSKIEADRLEVEAIPFDLQRLMQSTASLLALRATQKDLELITDLAPEVPAMVRGDPSRLRQILTNLVGNAIKFTEKGEVIMGLRPDRMADGRPGVRFSVRDTGVGIAPEKLADIFTEFTQADGSTSRRFGGTGLGLTISQRLAGLMGGSISVTSELGTGSEFSFTLPLAAEAVPGAVGKVASLTGRSILVVDDRAINRRIFGQMLAAEGARVEEAEGVASGLNLLRAARDAGTAPALAIVDAQMPGQDGYELASQIRADPSLAGTPLLMLTSTGRRGDAARCRELGVAGYLTKPVSRTDLLETVSAILGGDGTWTMEGAIVTRHSLAEAREPLRILIAEDNPVNQVVAATMLRKRGHQVDIAGNGREAVTAVQRVRYDLVLMDLQMPEMDGFEATAAIRALPDRRDLPIIALTAHAFAAEREHCLATGMNGFLSKPFRAHELFAIVEGRGVGSPPASPASSPAVVDLESLRGQLRAAGAEAALDGIVDTFLESVPERVQTLRNALALGTAAEVAAAAHVLKSSAGVIGAAPFSALLVEIEAAGRADTLSDKPLLADRVQDAATAVLADLRAYRGKAA